MEKRLLFKVYEQLLSKTDCMLSIIGGDYCYHYVNQSFANLFGLAVDEIVGRSVSEFYSPAVYRMEILPRLEGAMTKLETIEYQAWFVMGQSGLQYHSVRILPFSDADMQGPTLIVQSQNMTHQKRRLDEVQSQRELMRKIFEHSPDAIFLVDPQTGIIVDANLKAEQLILRPRHELIGLHQSELHPLGFNQQYNEGFRRHVAEVRQDGESIKNRASVVVRPDGEEIPVEIRSQLFRIGDQEIFQGIFQDMRKQHASRKIIADQNEKLQQQNEELMVGNQQIAEVNHRLSLREGQLHAHNNFLRILLDAIPYPLFYKDHRGKLLGCNHAFEKLSGKRLEEILNQYIGTVFTDKELGLFEACDQHLLETGSPSWEFACELYHHDQGRYLDYWLTEVVYKSEEENFSGILVLFFDQSDRKAREEILAWELSVNKAISELSLALIQMPYDLAAISALVVEKARELTDSQHALAGSINSENQNFEVHHFTLMNPDSCKMQESKVCFPISKNGHYSALWGHALNSREAFFCNNPLEHPSYRSLPKGHVPLDRYLAVPAIVNNELVGQVALANSPGDYTQRHVKAVTQIAHLYALTIQRKRMEEQVHISMNQAHKANKAKSEFLANMSHEIRTPMNAILGFAQILRDSKGDCDIYRNYIESIHNSGKSLLQLINDILDLSKIEAGRLEVSYKTLEISQLIDDVRQIFLLKTQEKGLEFVIEVGEGLPACIQTDETRLRQILFNLVGNAVKFTEKGYVKIGLWSEYKSSDTQKVDLYITVEDSGIGIPAEEHERIFEPFRQQHAQSTRRYGGTGLGLSITRRLLEMMNGEISVRSEVGKGSVFSICLSDVLLGEKDSDNLRDKSDNLKYHFSPMSILLVEDIASNRILIHSFLEDFDFDIVDAVNGLEALQAIDQHDFDLVLMDLQMPEMDGFEATTRIKARNPDLPVVALTAYAMDEQVERIKAQFDDYLRKPLSKEDLLGCLAHFLPHQISLSRKDPSQVSDNMDFISEFKLSLDARGGLSEGLKARVEKVLLPVVNSIDKKQSIKRIRELVDMILVLAQDYDLPVMRAFAEQLLLAVNSYKFARINLLLNQFKQILAIILAH